MPLTRKEQISRRLARHNARILVRILDRATEFEARGDKRAAVAMRRVALNLLLNWELTICGQLEGTE